MIDTLMTETLSVCDGLATCSEIPLGNVNVFLEDNTMEIVVPFGKTINVNTSANQPVEVVYSYQKKSPWKSKEPNILDSGRCKYCETLRFEKNIYCSGCGAPF